MAERRVSSRVQTRSRGRRGSVSTAGEVFPTPTPKVALDGMSWLWSQLERPFLDSLPLRSLGWKSKNGDQHIIEAVFLEAVLQVGNRVQTIISPSSRLDDKIVSRPEYSPSVSTSNAVIPSLSPEKLPLATGAPNNPLNWCRQPYVAMYMVTADSMESYRTKVRPGIELFLRRISNEFKAFKSMNDKKKRNSLSARFFLFGQNSKTRTPRGSFSGTKKTESKESTLADDQSSGTHPGFAATIGGAVSPNKNEKLAELGSPEFVKQLKDGLRWRVLPEWALEQEFIIVYVSSAVTSEYGGKGVRAKKGSSEPTKRTEKQAKVHRQIYAQLKTDFGADHCVWVDPEMPGGGLKMSSGNPGALLGKEEIKNEDPAKGLWGKIRELVVRGFIRRCELYETEIRRLDRERAQKGWDFWHFFLVKEGYALVLDQMELCTRALKQYLELSVMYENMYNVTNSRLKEQEEKLMAKHISPRLGPLLDLCSSAYRRKLLLQELHPLRFFRYVFARQMRLLFRMNKLTEALEKTTEFLPQLLTRLRRVQVNENEDKAGESSDLYTTAYGVAAIADVLRMCDADFEAHTIRANDDFRRAPNLSELSEVDPDIPVITSPISPPSGLEEKSERTPTPKEKFPMRVGKKPRFFVFPPGKNGEDDGRREVTPPRSPAPESEDVDMLGEWGWGTEVEILFWPRFIGLDLTGWTVQGVHPGSQANLRGIEPGWRLLTLAGVAAINDHVAIGTFLRAVVRDRLAGASPEDPAAPIPVFFRVPHPLGTSQGISSKLASPDRLRDSKAFVGQALRQIEPENDDESNGEGALYEIRQRFRVGMPASGAWAAIRDFSRLLGALAPKGYPKPVIRKTKKSRPLSETKGFSSPRTRDQLVYIIDWQDIDIDVKKKEALDEDEDSSLDVDPDEEVEEQPGSEKLDAATLASWGFSRMWTPPLGRSYVVQIDDVERTLKYAPLIVSGLPEEVPTQFQASMCVDGTRGTITVKSPDSRRRAKNGSRRPLSPSRACFVEWAAHCKAPGHKASEYDDESTVAPRDPRFAREEKRAPNPKQSGYYPGLGTVLKVAAIQALNLRSAILEDKWDPLRVAVKAATLGIEAFSPLNSSTELRLPPLLHPLGGRGEWMGDMAEMSGVELQSREHSFDGANDLYLSMGMLAMRAVRMLKNHGEKRGFLPKNLSEMTKLEPTRPSPDLKPFAFGLRFFNVNAEISVNYHTLLARLRKKIAAYEQKSNGDTKEAKDSRRKSMHLNVDLPTSVETKIPNPEPSERRESLEVPKRKSSDKLGEMSDRLSETVSDCDIKETPGTKISKSWGSQQNPVRGVGVTTEILLNRIYMQIASEEKHFQGDVDDHIARMCALTLGLNNEHAFRTIYNRVCEVASYCFDKAGAIRQRTMVRSMLATSLFAGGDFKNSYKLFLTEAVGFASEGWTKLECAGILKGSLALKQLSQESQKNKSELEVPKKKILRITKRKDNSSRLYLQSLLRMCVDPEFKTLKDFKKEIYVDALLENINKKGSLKPSEETNPLANSHNKIAISMEGFFRVLTVTSVPDFKGQDAEEKTSPQLEITIESLLPQAIKLDRFTVLVRTVHSDPDLLRNQLNLPLREGIPGILKNLNENTSNNPRILSKLPETTSSTEYYLQRTSERFFYCKGVTLQPRAPNVIRVSLEAPSEYIASEMKKRWNLLTERNEKRFKMRPTWKPRARSLHRQWRRAWAAAKAHTKAGASEVRATVQSSWALIGKLHLYNTFSPEKVSLSASHLLPTRAFASVKISQYPLSVDTPPTIPGSHPRIRRIAGKSTSVYLTISTGPRPLPPGTTLNLSTFSGIRKECGRGLEILIDDFPKSGMVENIDSLEGSQEVKVALEAKGNETRMTVVIKDAIKENSTLSLCVPLCFHVSKISQDSPAASPGNSQSMLPIIEGDSHAKSSEFLAEISAIIEFTPVPFSNKSVRSASTVRIEFSPPLTLSVRERAARNPGRYWLVVSVNALQNPKDKKDSSFHVLEKYSLVTPVGYGVVHDYAQTSNEGGIIASKEGTPLKIAGQLSGERKISSFDSPTFRFVFLLEKKLSETSTSIAAKTSPAGKFIIKTSKELEIECMIPPPDPLFAEGGVVGGGVAVRVTTPGRVRVGETTDICIKIRRSSLGRGGAWYCVINQEEQNMWLVSGRTRCLLCFKLEVSTSPSVMYSKNMGSVVFGSKSVEGKLENRKQIECATVNLRITARRPGNLPLPEIRLYRKNEDEENEGAGWTEDNMRPVPSNLISWQPSARPHVWVQPSARVKAQLMTVM